MKNAIERAVVMGNGVEILPDDLPQFASKPGYADLNVGLPLKEAIDIFKKEYIRLNLEHTGGNRTLAAKNMKIQRTYLSRLITRHNL
jgi:Nif-specific regulatory protein